MNWQPISTAPKDGTVVLLFQDGKYAVARWQDDSYQEQRLIETKGKLETYEWVTVEDGHWEPYPDEIYDPTHWAPLDAPK